MAIGGRIYADHVPVFLEWIKREKRLDVRVCTEVVNKIRSEMSYFF